MLVSSKCDKDQESWEVEHHIVDGMWTAIEGEESFQTSLVAPETHKRCLSVILRNVMLKKAGRSSLIYGILVNVLILRSYIE